MWRLGNARMHYQRVREWHKKEINYWGREVCTFCMLIYVNIRLVDFRECTSLVHYLCEGDSFVYKCLSYKSFITKKLEGYFAADLQENRDRQSELEPQMLRKKKIVKHKKTLLQLIFVRLSNNYWKPCITLRLFTRLMMEMSLLGIIQKIFWMSIRKYAG